MREGLSISEQLNKSMKQIFSKSQHRIKWSLGQTAIQHIVLENIL